MKLNARTIEKYFDGVSPKELQKFQDFLAIHPLKHTRFKGKSISYLCCGKGDKTMLTFSGGHSGPWSIYGSVKGFEKDFRMVVVDFSSCDNLDDFSACVNHVVELENIDKVCVTGQSLTGIFAQAYFRRNMDRVEAMVLTNTLAPKRERNRKWALVLFRILPFFLLKPLLKRSLARLGKIEADVPPEVEERLAFRVALLRHDLDRMASKRSLLDLLGMLFEFNEKDASPIGDFDQWPGKVLIVTSEDEPYREDVDMLMDLYPHSQIFSFPAGFRHAAPLIQMEKFQNLIKDFLLKSRPSS